MASFFLNQLDVDKLVLDYVVLGNGHLLTGKALSLIHVSSIINMASDLIWNLMNPSEILRDVEIFMTQEQMSWRYRQVSDNKQHE